VLGYLDDLILIPLGIAIVIKLIPADVLNECRVKAAQELSKNKPKNWIAGGIIIFMWICLFSLVAYYSVRFFKKAM